MKKKLVIICCIGCILLCGIMSGCGSTSDDETNNIALADSSGTMESEANEMSEDVNDGSILISTEYGDLCYPDQWREYISTYQEQNGENIVVTFQTECEGNEYSLFSIVIGNDESDVVGSITDNEGTQRNVYLQIDELPVDTDMSEEEQNRFYAMQEDLNYLIDNLK